MNYTEHTYLQKGSIKQNQAYKAYHIEAYVSKKPATGNEKR